MSAGPEQTGETMPASVRRIGLGVLGLLVAGAVWLIVARGDAILVDLAGLAGKVWCF